LLVSFGCTSTRFSMYVSSRGIIPGRSRTVAFVLSPPSIRRRRRSGPFRTVPSATSTARAGRLTVLGHLHPIVDEDGLLIGIAAAFAGTTALFAVLGFVYQPFLLFFAAIFGLATYLIWYHASGRLAARIRRTAGSARGRRGRRPNDASRGPRDFEGFGPGRRAADGAGERVGGRGRAGDQWSGRGSRTQRQSANEPTIAEAYRTLGLDPGADEAAVRAAYRERVKSVHPDADSGDEEQFKRVNRAYERLTN
jgi:hypothetical protein